MSNDSQIKEVVITGGSTTKRAPRGSGGSRSSGTRKKKLVLDKEGGGTSPGTLTQLSTSSVGPVLIEKVLPAASSMTNVTARVGTTSPAVETGLPKAPAGGSVKVVLKPKKKATRVHLAPKKGGAVVPHIVEPVQPANSSGGGKKTRKASRSIKMNLPGLNKKLNKAKTIRQDAQKETLDQVKKVLHKAGLVKTDTKAPESILRQMYSDFMMLKNRAL